MLIQRWSKISLFLAIGCLLLTFSNFPPGDQLERIRAFSRPLEFDYISWTLQAFGTKIGQAAVETDQYLDENERHRVVLDYLDLVTRIHQTEGKLNDIYADPQVKNPESASALVRQQLADLQAERERLAPVAEAIIQDQISEVVAELDLTLGGQPLPPVLYHSTPLPTALIVSPREEIWQEHNISLEPDINVDARAILEDKVDEVLDVSSLIVDIGGIGVYPTMVIETSNLDYLTEVVAHEWVHNFLTLRPLGLNYNTNPELRTMNETAASLAGEEIGRAVMERFYPELLPPPPPPDDGTEESVPPAFDFREEMRITRVTVDALLAAGRIEEAEKYMEARRLIFWENGYHLRKLNQAYFAFYGAYADEPGGAAGEDPVGAAVRELRAESPSLSSFLKRISWMFSYEDLIEAVELHAD